MRFDKTMVERYMGVTDDVNITATAKIFTTAVTL